MSAQRSQTGGETAFRGLDYQKKFIARIRNVAGKKPIIRISCEHQDDIELSHRQAHVQGE